MSWLTDGTVKADRRAIPSGEDAKKWVSASDMNAIRDHLIKGPLIGFTVQASRPTATDATRYLWVRSSDDKLLYYNGTTDVDLAAGGGGGGHTIQSPPGSSLTARTNLTFDGTELVATDDAGSDQTDVTLGATLTAKTFTSTAAANFAARLDKNIVAATNNVYLELYRQSALKASIGLGIVDDLLFNQAGSTRLTIGSTEAAFTTSVLMNGAGSQEMRARNTSGTAASLVIDKTFVSAGNYTYVDVKRNNATQWSVESDASDNPIFSRNPSSRNTVLDWIFRRLTSDASHALDGIGCGILLQSEDTGGSLQDAGAIRATLRTATAGSEKGDLALWALNGSGSIVAGASVWGTQRVWLGAVQATEPDATVVMRSAGSALAADAVLTLDKDSSAQNFNYFMRARRSGGSYIFGIWMDTSDSTNITTLGVNQKLRLQYNATTMVTMDSSGLNFANVGHGFFGATPIAKPTVSGSRADTEAALADLLTELANLGLITNSTTA